MSEKTSRKEILDITVEKINKKNNDVVVGKTLDIITVDEKNTQLKGVPLMSADDIRAKNNNYCANGTHSDNSLPHKKYLSSENSEKKGVIDVFEKLYKINVNDYVEKKDGLTYLSWTYAWAELKKRYPKATYTIKQFGENKLPYVYDENTGYMVFTEVTIDDITHSMWLPVMDSKNKAMRNKPYTYDTKFKKNIPVAPATMFDINKAIMRCLVKNLAMFGLGLYIYAGEDLPIESDEIVNVSDTAMLSKLEKEILSYGDKADNLKANMLKKYNVKTLKGLSNEQIKEALKTLRDFKKLEK